jgi:hypothetical protein
VGVPVRDADLAVWPRTARVTGGGEIVARVLIRRETEDDLLRRDVG